MNEDSPPFPPRENKNKKKEKKALTCNYPHSYVASYSSLRVDTAGKLWMGNHQLPSKGNKQLLSSTHNVWARRQPQCMDQRVQSEIL